MKSIILVVSILFSGIVYAQEKMPSHEEMLGQALDDYGKIAGAWHLSQKCSLLNSEDATKFENSVATITIALRSDIPDPSILLRIQKTTKKVTESEPYSNCKEKAKEVILGGVILANNWAKQIKRIHRQQKG